MARALAVFVLLGSPHAAHRVWAQDIAPASLAYERSSEATSCPDETEFREVVAERLGRDPFVADASRVVHVLLVRDGRDFVGTVRLSDAGRDRSATRTLRARSCESVATSLATVIAMGLEPSPSAPDAVDTADRSAEPTPVTEPETELTDVVEDAPVVHPPETTAAVASASTTTTVQVVVVPPQPEEEPPPRRRRALIVVGVLAIAGAVLAVGLTRSARTNYADYTPTDVSVAALRFGR